VFVPPLARSRTGEADLEQIALVASIVERYPETFAMARTAADVRRIHKSGRIASLIGVEGGGQIDQQPRACCAPTARSARAISR
jgi:membrane dipeptidase